MPSASVDPAPTTGAADIARVIAWMRDPQRPPAITAFTAGDERQLAYAFEDGIASARRAALLEAATLVQRHAYALPGSEKLVAWLGSPADVIAAIRALAPEAGR